MPQLSELANNRKFVKKEYRPWDLSGSGTVDNKDTTIPPIDSNNSVVATEKLSSLTPEQVTKGVTIDAPKTIETELPITKEISENLSGNKSRIKTGNEQVTIKQHQGNNEITEKKQLNNIQRTIRKQLHNEIDNVIDNSDKTEYLTYEIKKLSGIQKSIFQFVIDVCSARGALDTGILLATELANAANCSVGSAKTSLIRLIEKGLIIRLEGKASRGGHMILAVTKNIQVAEYHAQQALYNPLRKKHLDNITNNNSNNSHLPISSSNKNINTTNLLSDEWKQINFEPLSHIGFSETQLFQLNSSNMCLPEIVQDAIYKFAYSLNHSEKAKAYNDPLNVLMGVLRKGQRWNEPNYMSEKEIALKEILEERRKQKEKLDAMINELFDIEFPDWKRKLSAEELARIVPEEIRNSNFTAAIQSSLKTYFIDHILKPRFDP